MVGDKVVGVRCWLQMCRKETSRDRGRGQTGAIAGGGAQCSCTCLHLNPGWYLPWTRPAPILRLPCTGSGAKWETGSKEAPCTCCFWNTFSSPLVRRLHQVAWSLVRPHSRHLERAAAAANAMAARQPGWTERLILGVINWKSGPMMLGTATLRNDSTV